MWTPEVLFCSLSRFLSLMVFRTACFFPAEVRKTKNPSPSSMFRLYLHINAALLWLLCTLTHTHSHALSGVQRTRRFGVPVWPLPLFVCLSLALLSPLLGCHGNSPTHSVRHITSTWQPALLWVNGRSRAAAVRSRTKIKSSRCSWKLSGYSHSSRK